MKCRFHQASPKASVVMPYLNLGPRTSLQRFALRHERFGLLLAARGHMDLSPFLRQLAAIVPPCAQALLQVFSLSHRQCDDLTRLPGNRND